MPQKNFLRNKRILVVGAAGSIGSALARTIAKKKPKKLVIFDCDETGIFDLYEELKDKCNVDYVIGSIRDAQRMMDIFGIFKPQIVYHAAAYKHVSLMEKYPEEAQKTNVQGTKNLIAAATTQNTTVEKFIFISSDKAVNPKCVMGETKKEGEELCLAANYDSTKEMFNVQTRFIVVRFGNVMASRGSLLPIWQKQIAENRDLTVTHRSMQRFFMGIYEAVDLVLEASRIGEGGDILVLNMGEQMKIVELARWMIRMSGKPLEIEYTKPKKGEKYSEELMTEDEGKRAKKVGNLFVIKSYDEEKG